MEAILYVDFKQGVYKDDLELKGDYESLSNRLKEWIAHQMVILNFVNRYGYPHSQLIPMSNVKFISISKIVDDPKPRENEDIKYIVDDDELKAFFGHGPDYELLAEGQRIDI